MRKPKTGHIVLRLTPRQFRAVWDVLDGAIDAGSCSDGSGNSPMEQRVLNNVMEKMLPHVLAKGNRP